MRENRVFIAALALSIVFHLYLFKGEFGFEFFEVKRIEIPVTFIPGAEKEVAEVKEREEQQIQVPEQRPAGTGYYSASARDRVVNLYLDTIREEIEKRKFTPPESKYFGLIGNAVVGFIITGDGDFADIQILNSSGDELLDMTALRAVAETAGRVKRPAAAGRNSMRVHITVKYQYGL